MISNLVYFWIKYNSIILKKKLKQVKLNNLIQILERKTWKIILYILLYVKYKIIIKMFSKEVKKNLISFDLILNLIWMMHALYKSFYDNLFFFKKIK